MSPPSVQATVETFGTAAPKIDASSKRKTTVFTTAKFLDAVNVDKRDLVIFESGVYDLSKFKKRHPGGQLVIENVVGKDATEELHAFHPKSVLTDKLPGYKVGAYLHTDDVDSILTAADVPHLCDSDLHRDYLALNEKLRALGFYEPDVWFYIRRFAWFACFFVFNLSLVASHSSEPIYVAASAVSMGLFWHMMSFASHDLGHHSCTGSSKLDTIISICLANYCGGISIGWWNYSHNTHHVVTNHPEHDPDIQHLPFLAVSEEFFGNLFSTYHKKVLKFDFASRVFVSIQHYFFLIVMSFGRLNLYVQSWNHLLTGPGKNGSQVRRFAELTGMAFFWLWYGYGLLYLTIPTWPLRILYFVLSHMATIVLHIQITLSHFAMSTDTPDAELFVQKGLRTTMDVECPPWMDFLHGGLQFQVIHHLFPRMPRPHFRAVKPFVQEFCKKHNLDYQCYGFLHGNGLVYGVLKGVADQVNLFAHSSQPSVRYQAKNND